MSSILICPHCKAELVKTEHRTFQCESNHSFDVSKEGYLNLLPVNKKKSKEPGDNELMIAARREFLEEGNYDPLVASIKAVITQDLAFEKKDFLALDAGCGEGYYSEHAIRKASTKAIVLGTDISKYAVKNAAKKYKDNLYFVSSVYNIPVKSDSMGVILSVFSPIEPTEFKRILNHKGFLVVVSPAENHMKQLAELIYDSFRPHEHKIVEEMPDSFDHYLSKRTTFDIEIKSSATLQALHKMTPYYYNTSKEGQEKVANCSNIKVTCDFHISVFKKASAQ